MDRKTMGLIWIAMLLIVAGCRRSEQKAIEDAKPPEATKPEVVATCTGGSVAPSIEGSYKDNYGDSQDVGAQIWTMGMSSTAELVRKTPIGRASTSSSIFTYCTVNNTTNVIIAQNGPNNEYYPNLYSQFNWTTSGGNLWYCQIAYDAATEQAAAAVPPADPSNPSQSGCGSFPWSELIPN